MTPKGMSTPLPDGCSIKTISDARVYKWPTAGQKVLSVSPKPYSHVICLDNVVVKLPSSYGFGEYEKYVVNEKTDNDAIRGNESIEKLQNLGQLLTQYNSFREACSTVGDKKVHWLLLHILQYDRLKKVIKIPTTRYCFFQKKGLLSSTIHPGLVQQRIAGIPLWDMIDHNVVHEDREHTPFVKEKYEPLIPHISSQLRPLATPSLSMHINWHIMNFIFEPKTNVLYYLDLKPSSIFGRWRNEHNLKNIRRDFLR